MEVREVMCLRPRRLLEIAAGDGALAATLAQSGCEVTANDLRGDMLTQSLTSFTTGGSVRVCAGNFFDLDPDSVGLFDVVAACEVIEHVAHPDEMLASLKRFLVPGGRLFLTTPSGSFLRNRLPTFRQIEDFSALEAEQFKPDADGHLFLFTPRELFELATSTGFEVERMSVWGSPLLTGNCGLSRFSSSALTRLAYLAEQIVQSLPGREYLCTAITTVLRVPTRDEQ